MLDPVEIVFGTTILLANNKMIFFISTSFICFAEHTIYYFALDFKFSGYSKLSPVWFISAVYSN